MTKGDRDWIEVADGLPVDDGLYEIHNDAWIVFTVRAYWRFNRWEGETSGREFVDVQRWRPITGSGS